MIGSIDQEGRDDVSDLRMELALLRADHEQHVRLCTVVRRAIWGIALIFISAGAVKLWDWFIPGVR